VSEYQKTEGIPKKQIELIQK